MQLSFDPTLLILPLLYALGAFVLLMLLSRLLRRYGTLRGLGGPYLLGAIVLCLGIGLATALRRFGLAVDPLVEHILLAVLLFCWGFVGLGLIENLLIERWMKQSGLTIPRLVRDIGRAIAFTIAILISLQLLFNISPNSIVISSTVLSAVLGLALQDLLKNLIAGVALQLERPFDVNHWIQVDGDIGKVVEMSWRATRVITVDGNFVVYPNATLAQSNVINYTLPTPLQAMHVQIAVAHDHPPNLVKRTLIESTLASPEVAPDPLPSIKVHAYGDYSVTYDIKFWLHNYDRYPDKRDTVMTNAWYALKRAGIRLPLPVREVYSHEVDADLVASEQEQRITRVLSELRKAEFLEALDNEELRTLAERVHVRLYGIGDVLVRQGTPGDALFILRSGRVRVDMVDPQYHPPTTIMINELGPGDFFGEMALLTGAPRGASVTAIEDTEVLIVGKADLAPLLYANPELPERLGEMLELRRKMNQITLAQHRSGDTMPDASDERRTIGMRIRHFFGL